MNVVLTEDEAELVLLALSDFRTNRLHEYDDESRPQIAAELASATRKIRAA